MDMNLKENSMKYILNADSFKAQLGTGHGHRVSTQSSTLLQPSYIMYCMCGDLSALDMMYMYMYTLNEGANLLHYGEASQVLTPSKIRDRIGLNNSCTQQTYFSAAFLDSISLYCRSTCMLPENSSTTSITFH